MNAVAEALVRAILDAGIASGTREGAMLAQLAARALQASGLTSPELPPSGPSCSPDAKRMREKRARERAERSGERSTPNGEHHEQNERVRTEGEGGGLSSLSGNRDLEDPKGGGVGEGTFERSNAFASVRRIRNASDDGAWGMTVEAWCEGISDATGVPCTRPTHGQVRQLLDCQAKHRPVTAEPVAWSRSSAGEYARATSGRELSTFGYVRWLDSGKTAPVERVSGTVVKAPPDPETLRRLKKQDEEERVAREARLCREAEEGARRYEERRRTGGKGQ